VRRRKTPSSALKRYVTENEPHRRSSNRRKIMSAGAQSAFPTGARTLVNINKTAQCRDPVSGFFHPGGSFFRRRVVTEHGVHRRTSKRRYTVRKRPSRAWCRVPERDSLRRAHTTASISR